MRSYSVVIVAVLALAACGGDGDSADTTTSFAAAASAITTTTSTAATTVAPADVEVSLSAAEAFIDAFYSFDPARLEAALPSGAQAIPSVGFYQGWAEGGNHQIVDRKPCSGTAEIVSCSITVRDDLAKALNLDFNVTDTFILNLAGGEITDVSAISDTPLVGTAVNWVLDSNPELMDGACAGFFDGGPTPGECMRAVAQGAKDFAASDAAGPGPADPAAAALEYAVERDGMFLGGMRGDLGWEVADSYLTEDGGCAAVAVVSSEAASMNMLLASTDHYSIAEVYEGESD